MEANTETVPFMGIRKKLKISSIQIEAQFSGHTERKTSKPHNEDNR